MKEDRDVLDAGFADDEDEVELDALRRVEYLDVPVLDFDDALDLDDEYGVLLLDVAAAFVFSAVVGDLVDLVGGNEVVDDEDDEDVRDSLCLLVTEDLVLTIFLT